MILHPILETERLIMRVPEMADFAAYRAILLADAEGYLGGPFDADDAWDEYCKMRGRWALRGTGQFAVTLKDGTLIGFCGVDKERDDPADELGYLFLPAFHGKGYGTEAALAARDFARNTLGIRLLVSCVSNENAASVALARKLGAVPAPELYSTKMGDVTIYRHPEPEVAL
ncbi:MAG: GNAT family N-acetyltransferase [Paracoccaceae bacterium]